MEFVNRTVIRNKELEALSRGTRKSVRKRRGIIVKIFAALVIGLNLLLAWASWRGEDRRWWLNVAVAIILLVITLWEDLIYRKMTGRYVQPDAQEVTTVFGPDGFTQTSKAANGDFRYNQIQHVCETSQYFLFYLDHNLGQVYDKSGFTKGTPMAFREFITKKTGKLVQNIR